MPEDMEDIGEPIVMHYSEINKTQICDCATLLEEMYEIDSRINTVDLRNSMVLGLWTSASDRGREYAYDQAKETLKENIPKLKEISKKIIDSVCVNEQTKKQVEKWIPLLDNNDIDEAINIGVRIFPLVIRGYKDHSCKK